MFYVQTPEDRNLPQATVTSQILRQSHLFPPYVKTFCNFEISRNRRGGLFRNIILLLTFKNLSELRKYTEKSFPECSASIITIIVAISGCLGLRFNIRSVVIGTYCDFVIFSFKLLL